MMHKIVKTSKGEKCSCGFSHKIPGMLKLHVEYRNAYLRDQADYAEATDKINYPYGHNGES